MNSKDAKKICCGIFTLIFLEIPDLVLDIDFCVEIFKTTQPQIKDSNLRWAILLFCIFGFLFFIAEMYFLVRNLRKEVKYFLPGIFSLLGTILEDIPQIILALYVAIIEDKKVADVQYWKAAFAIVEASVRNIILVVYICRKYNSYKDVPKAKIVIAITQLFIGVAILCISFAIFALAA